MRNLCNHRNCNAGCLRYMVRVGLLFCKYVTIILIYINVRFLFLDRSSYVESRISNLWVVDKFDMIDFFLNLKSLEILSILERA